MKFAQRGELVLLALVLFVGMVIGVTGSALRKQTALPPFLVITISIAAGVALFALAVVALVYVTKFRSR
jgi:cytochrome b subunit of formate dehydrogenase